MNETYRGGNKLILGIVLGVITFWLFAQSLVNVVPNLQQSFGADMGTISIAVSLTALFSGMFVVGAGGLADKIGRVKMTNIGLLLSIIGSALIIIRSCYTRCISSVYYAFHIGHYENLLSGC